VIHSFPSHDEFAYAVAAEGPQAFEHEINRLASHAADQGLGRDVLEVLIDQSMPEVLRQRAFGAVMRALARTSALAAPSPG
jgi:hypothetical protein